ncbi:MAG TPA: hypothetical protein VIC61_02865 [Gammaproteobacteria bacterium]|jgi:hypothetical protein
MRILSLLLLLNLAWPAAARMYQWVDPDTDTPQLSGKPPPWYRSREGGPRVVVYDKDRLIDDTQVVVPDAEREQLRQDALIQAERDQAAINEKLLEAKRMQAVLDRNRPAVEEAPVVEAPPPEPEPVAAPPQAVNEAPTIEAMRALVESWDAHRTNSARDLANGDDPGPAPASP